jgi:uncharacterized membrane protein YoaK (UPF0700 family)
MDRPSLLADPRHGPLPALMLALTFVSGVVDAVSILALGRVFVANMTGNVVFIGFALAGAPGFSLVASVAALLGFLVGALVGGLVVDRYGTSRAIVLRNTVAVEVVLLAGCLGVSLVVHLREGGPISTTVVAGTAAVAMGMQNAAARRIAVPDMTTSVLTMTLTGFAADHLHSAKGAPLRRLLVVATMLAGATVGALLVLQVGSHAGLGLVVVLLAAVCAVSAFAARRPGDWQS